jgi:hypothetical protein
LTEYGKVVNHFIRLFWMKPVSKAELLKDIVNSSNSWLSARLKKVAAREAIAMVSSVKNVFASQKQRINDSIKSIEAVLKGLDTTNKKARRKAQRLRTLLKSKRMRLASLMPIMPRHAGKSMSISCTVAELQEIKDAKGFDAWLHLSSVGRGTILDLPVRFHKHFNRLSNCGRRLNSYVVSSDTVQFAFEVETGIKRQIKTSVGIDTGIKALATLSIGERFGTDIQRCIDRTKRCRYGSNGHKRASRALRQRIDEVAKQVIGKADLVVVENLKGISANTKLKGRLSKNMRSSIGRWNQRYWLGRLQQDCEWNRVSFRSVSPYNTSITCSACGDVDRANRVSQEMFVCSVCSHTENADVNAAKNILNRFVTGKYGSCCKV